MYRNLMALPGLVALAATTAAAQQPQTKACEIDENKPTYVATSALFIQQARAFTGTKRVDAIKKAVKALTEKGDAQPNPVGRNYQLGKAFFVILDDSTTPRMLTRGALGFTTDPTTMVDVGVLGDSVMRIVETAMPECVSLTRTWRRQAAWLRTTQAASNFYNNASYDSAAAYAKRSMMLDPSAPYAYSILASLAQRNNDIPGAIDWTRKAAEAAKSDTVFAEQRRLSLFNIGILVGSQAEGATGDEQKKLARSAADAFQAFLAEAPKTDESAPNARASLARMLSIAGDTAAVKATYAAVLSNPTAYTEYDLVQAGLAASRAGRDLDAISLFKVAVDQNPYGRDALFNISASMFNAGQSKEMLPYVKRLVEIDPNNPEAWRIMAGAYQGLAKAEKAPKVKAALNDTLLKAFTRFQDMPTVLSVRTFTHDGTNSIVKGSIENRGTAAGNYTLVVDFLDKAGAVVATKTVTVGPVAPKAKVDFVADGTGAGIVAFRYAIK